MNPTPPDHNTDASKQDESIPFASQTSVQTTTFSSSWQKQGWRERHSLHFFATITAPRLAGSCHCNFWSSAVVQASFTEPVILHAIAALGALHEAMLRRLASQDPNPHNAKAHLFVMQQCRKVIGRLTTKGRSKKSARDHLLVLTACALFSTIELLQDKLDDMATHGLQARKLLSGYGDEGAISTTRSTSSVSAITLANLQPVVERLALQSRIFVAEPTASPGGNSNTTVEHRPKLILPASVPSISSLVEAQLLLFRILMPTLLHQQTAFPCNRRTTAPRKSEHLRCERLLRDWERAFTAFLSLHVRHFTLDEVRQARVMKANHLYAHMVARIDALPQRGFDVWSYFIPDFEAIVHLAVAVLEGDDINAYASASASTHYCKLDMNNDPSSEDEPTPNPHPATSTSTSTSAPVLSIIEPLYFTSLWCPSATLRHRAIALLEACQRTPQPDARSVNEQWASWTPRMGTPRMAMAASRDVCVAISRDRVLRNLARPSYPTAVAVAVRGGRMGGGGWLR